MKIAKQALLPSGANANFDFGRLCKRFLLLAPSEASFEKRRFRSSRDDQRLLLESIGQTFIAAYNAALAASSLSDIVAHVERVSPSDRGFAAEGASMGVAIADAFRPAWLPEFINALQPFNYLIHVGAGWAIARIRWRRKAILASLDPTHRWLALDGLGFHDTYFEHESVVTGWRRERVGYAAKAYDQGVGRALWFVFGGSGTEAARCINALPSARQSDLWAGLGLAMAYAGQAAEPEIVATLGGARSDRRHLLQGIAFACEARALGQFTPQHTELVARIATGRSADNLATVVRSARVDAEAASCADDVPAYERWRELVADQVEDFARMRS